MSNLGIGISPGNVAVHRNCKDMKVIDGRIRVSELILRCLIICLGVAGAVLVGTDSQVREIFTVRKTAKFTDLKALVFLVIANVIAAVYSLAQGMRCVVSMVKGNVLFSKSLAWAIFSADQIMAYVMVAAVAAVVQSSVIAKLGQPELQWMKTCTLYEKFCNQVGEGLATSVILSLITVVLSCFSAFGLFRLYGNNKAGKGDLTW